VDFPQLRCGGFSNDRSFAREKVHFPVWSVWLERASGLCRGWKMLVVVSYRACGGVGTKNYSLSQSLEVTSSFSILPIINLRNSLLERKNYRLQCSAKMLFMVNSCSNEPVLYISGTFHYAYCSSCAFCIEFYEWLQSAVRFITVWRDARSNDSDRHSLMSISQLTHFFAKARKNASEKSHLLEKSYSELSMTQSEMKSK
jgi:hypothetical protein